MEPFTIKPNHIVIKCCGVLCPLMLVHLASKFKIFCGKADGAQLENASGRLNAQFNKLRTLV